MLFRNISVSLYFASVLIRARNQGSLSAAPCTWDRWVSGVTWKRNERYELAMLYSTVFDECVVVDSREGGAGDEKHDIPLANAVRGVAS